ncbi:hypothetical protein E1265_24930 [Streptomyces sp. 8K308]|uniref:hypothetical protein n=1 Tax=Streptomyces sp. 8K308 TaxID=2530388 RepID=UPI0010476207|nr:hypothetical protein [Streptomyces sp. 8K308]TDC18631.1 hypothetical protein E1265_24930 [Streptomyces sp. 8K308]
MLLVWMLSMVYGTKEYASPGVEPTSSLVPTVGLAVGAAFVSRQRNLPFPLLDLRLFGNHTFTAAPLVLSLAMLVMSGGQFFMAQFLQTVAGYPPLDAGLLLLPISVTMVIGVMTAPGLTRCVPPAT